MITDDPDDIGRVFPLARHPKLLRSRETVAIHEAGHAVAALALNVPCYAARIANEGETAAGGFAMSPAAELDVASPQIHDPAPEGYHAALSYLLSHANRIALKQAALDLATAAAAGRQAEIIAAGLPWPGVLFSYDKDGHSTRAYLATAFPPPMGLGYVQRRAHVLVTKRWSEVEMIAARLIATGTWTRDDGPAL